MGDGDYLFAYGDDLVEEWSFLGSKSGYERDLMSPLVEEFDQSVDRLAASVPYRRCRELFVGNQDSRHITAWWRTLTS